jgi:biopolymer transport protein TolR
MGMNVGGGKGAKADINVTPLVDVVLVLLIIFMVVTPMLQRGKDVNLPRATQTEEDDKATDPLILSVTKERTTWVESDQFDDAGLALRLDAEFRTEPNRRILLKGDETLTVGDVRKVMEVARKSGARGISLGVESEKE